MIFLSSSNSRRSKRRNSRVDNLFQQFLTALKAAIFVSCVICLSVLTAYSYPTFKFICLELAPSFWKSLCNFLTPPYLFLLLNLIILTLAITASYHPGKGKMKAGTGPNIGLKRESLPADDNATDATTNNQIVVPEIIEKSASMPQREDDPETVASSSHPEAEEWLQLEEHQEKRLVSGRFAKRRPVKEGVGPKPLGIVSRNATKKGDTVEAIWRSVCQKRHKPLNRHLHKSVSWDSSSLTRSQTSSKSVTNTLHRAAAAPPVRREEEVTANMDSTKRPPINSRRREPSMSSDELNKRVEAFIAQFNHQIRLQKQKSIVRYMNMVGKGAAYNIHQ